MTPEALAATHAAAFSGRDRAWSAAEFASLLGQPTTILTGDDDSFVLGRVVVDEAEVLTLATRPDRRRRGLARAALAAFESEAQRRGARMAYLEVAADNASAMALYEAAGWHEFHRRAGYYANPNGAHVDALELRKRLETPDS